MLRLLALVGGLVGVLAAPASVLGEVTSARSGFAVLVHGDDPSIKEGVVVIRYEGTIEAPMAERLAGIWAGLQGKYKTVIVHLNSSGGALKHAEEVSAVLKGMRTEVELVTFVYQGQSCLSACLLVFMQGAERIAGGATSWLFHGACPEHSNVPSLRSTRHYVNLLREAGVSTEFLRFLEDCGYLTNAGAFWASGYELAYVHKANIITRLLAPWQPETPIFLPGDPQIRPR